MLSPHKKAKTSFMRAGNLVLSSRLPPAAKRKPLSILHYPRLDTVLMVEDAIKNFSDYPTKTELWQSLPKKMQYQTLCVILDYLLASNKIIMAKDRRIVWIFADNEKLKQLLQTSVPYNG